MAYQTKYKFVWDSTNGQSYEIQIQKDGYSGSAIKRPLGGAPLLKRKSNGNIYGSSLELAAECLNDGEFTELYTSNPLEYRVRLLQGSTVIWVGFVEPELYSEPDIAPPYDVSIVATDGLGELKQHTFSPQGAVSIDSLLSYILAFTGNAASRSYISSITAYTEGPTPSPLTASQVLSAAVINIDYMEGKTCYQVLQYLLDTLHAGIMQFNTGWLIFRETDLSYNSSTGNIPLVGDTNLTGAVRELGKMGASATIGSIKVWPVGQLSTKIEPASNQVTVVGPYHTGTPLVNPDMVEDTGWSKFGTASYDSTLGAYEIPASSNISQVLYNVDLTTALTLSAIIGSHSSEEEDYNVRVSFFPGGNLEDEFVIPPGYPNSWLRYDSLTVDDRKNTGVPLKRGAEGSPVSGQGTVPAFDTWGPDYGYIGTLMVYFEHPALVYSCHLEKPVSKGWKDVLNISNGARNSASEVEIAIGRCVSSLSSYKAFLRGLLLYNGLLVTNYTDANVYNQDYLALICRNCALSVARPRLRVTGKVDTPAAFRIPLVLIKSSVSYILETLTWDLLNDDMDISALSLPAATFTSGGESVTDISKASAEGTGAGSGKAGSDKTIVSGSSVTWNQIVGTGTKIAEIKVNGQTKNVYAPTGEFNPEQLHCEDIIAVGFKAANATLFTLSDVSEGDTITGFISNLNSGGTYAENIALRFFDANGNTISTPVGIYNATDVVEKQFTVTIPEGFSYAKLVWAAGEVGIYGPEAALSKLPAIEASITDSKKWDNWVFAGRASLLFTTTGVTVGTGWLYFRKDTITQSYNHASEQVYDLSAGSRLLVFRPGSGLSVVQESGVQDKDIVLLYRDGVGGIKGGLWLPLYLNATNESIPGTRFVGDINGDATATLNCATNPALSYVKLGTPVQKDDVILLSVSSAVSGALANVGWNLAGRKADGTLEIITQAWSTRDDASVTIPDDYIDLCVCLRSYQESSGDFYFTVKFQNWRAEVTDQLVGLNGDTAEKIPTTLDADIAAAFNRMAAWETGKEKICFAIITDTHAGTNDVNNRQTASMMQHFGQWGLDFMAHLGDTGIDVAYSSVSSAHMYDIMNYLRRCFVDAPVPVLFVNGNHEAAIDSVATPSLRREYFNLPIERKYPGVEYVDGKLYGKYVNEDKQFVVFILDNFETNNFTATQANWFISELNAVPTGWSIIILEHVIPYYLGLWRKGDEHRDPVSSDEPAYYAAVRELIAAYNHRSSGTLSYNSAAYDFSSASAKIYGLFSGHSHFDTDYNVSGMLLVCHQSMGSLNLTTEMPSWGVFNSFAHATQTLVDVVCICPSSDKVKIFRIGAGGSAADRAFTLIN